PKRGSRSGVSTELFYSRIRIRNVASDSAERGSESGWFDSLPQPLSTRTDRGFWSPFGGRNRETGLQPAMGEPSERRCHCSERYDELGLQPGARSGLCAFAHAGNDSHDAVAISSRTEYCRSKRWGRALQHAQHLSLFSESNRSASYRTVVTGYRNQPATQGW